MESNNDIIASEYRPPFRLEFGPKDCFGDKDIMIMSADNKPLLVCYSTPDTKAILNCIVELLNQKYKMEIPKGIVKSETAEKLATAGYPQDEWVQSVRQKYGRETFVMPTLYQASYWLRTCKSMFCEVIYQDNGYCANLMTLPSGKCLNLGFKQAWDTYEEALEAGVQAACKYLIEKGARNEEDNVQ